MPWILKGMGEFFFYQNQKHNSIIQPDASDFDSTIESEWDHDYTDAAFCPVHNKEYAPLVINWSYDILVVDLIIGAIFASELKASIYHRSENLSPSGESITFCFSIIEWTAEGKRICMSRSGEPAW